MESKKRIVIKNGQKVNMTYEEVCEDLGIIAGIGFVKVTNAGTIGFTIGKPHEVKLLYRRIIEKGYKPTKGLMEALESWGLNK